MTYLIESDFDNARRSFQEAITADPRSFEAHYGRAILEQDAGFADEALSEAKQAEKLAPNVVSRDAAHAIARFTEPYAKKTLPNP
jgi:Tfp pilus assembly protein PilF